MPRKHTTQSFIDKASKKHQGRYDYSRVNYVNTLTKVEIRCPEHGSYFTTPNSHLQGKGRCSSCVGGITYTGNKFIEKAKQVHNPSHYDYSNVDYKNSNTPVRIICPIHGEFSQKPAVHLRGNGCPKCGIHKRTIKQTSDLDTFIRKVFKVHPKYDFSKFKYINARTKGIVICPVHGEFKATPDSLLRGHKCIKCTGHYSPTTLEFIKRAKDIHNNKYDYTNVSYTNAKQSISIKCPIHGIFTQIAEVHLRGNGCPSCGVIASSDAKRLGQEEFIEKSKKIHQYIDDLSNVQYIDCRTPIELICPKHGSYKIIPNNYLSGRRCSKCSANTSYKANAYLSYISLLIPDIKIEHLISNTRYWADGFDPLTNTIYEFHGDFWHGNPALYNSEDINPVTGTTFGELYVKTVKKREKCISLGYKYIEVWENEWLKGIQSLRKLQKNYKNRHIS